MKTSRFQLIFLTTLVIFIIAGVIAFATYKTGSSKNQLSPITVWGTFPKDVFDQYVTQINYGLTQQMTVNYVQETPQSFSRDFVAALARGVGPDAILIPADLLLTSADKLTPIPYSVLPQRTFVNTFVDGASVYLSQDGELGIPFVADPLVMYWNRDMFNSAGIVVCPDPTCTVYWEQFAGFNDKLTIKQDNGSVTRSAVALGDFTNVSNAREILGTLFLQQGNPITIQNKDGTVSSALKPTSSASPVPAVDFFAQSVNPNSPNYSWNRSWPNSKTAFLAGNLATYFGLASELSDIRAKNPNLNFDIAPLPQWRSGKVKAAYARFFGFSIVKASQNANTAYQIISTLTQPQYLAKISSTLYLPSVSKSVIASGSSDPYMDIFNKEALVSKTWLDVDPTQSSQIFGNMMQMVTSGQKSVTEALNEADNTYNSVLRQAVSPTASIQPGSMNVAAAIDGVPPVDINAKPTTEGKPFGAFSLVKCDGPDLSGLTQVITVTVNGKEVSNTPASPGVNGQNPPGYVPCNFKGLMMQAQYLINVMIVLGVIGLIIGLSYAGYLYIKGDQDGRKKAKDMLPKMIGGLLLMLTGWFIVYQILFWLTGTTVYLTN